MPIIKKLLNWHKLVKNLVCHSIQSNLLSYLYCKGDDIKFLCSFCKPNEFVLVYTKFFLTLYSLLSLCFFSKTISCSKCKNFDILSIRTNSDLNFFTSSYLFNFCFIFWYRIELHKSCTISSKFYSTTLIVYYLVLQSLVHQLKE